jgi:hypothetical protein
LVQETGAFVYGAMSLMDKVANGLTYQFIELFNPQCEKKSERYLRVCTRPTDMQHLATGHTRVRTLLPTRVGVRDGRLPHGRYCRARLFVAVQCRPAVQSTATLAPFLVLLCGWFSK